jgi:Domain of unknown function (DUF5658)
MTGIVAPQPHMLIASSDALYQARTARLTRFGNWAIVLFLVMQGLDGVFTYVGLAVYGPSIEANPLLAWLMHVFGPGPALAGAKLTAAGLGIILHLVAVHRAVALLTLLYAFAAILPWTHILFLQHP